MRLTTLAAALALTLSLCAAHAQEPSDVYKVDYFENANTADAMDATLYLTNPGTGGPDICANIYVFDANQEISECCSCMLSMNGLRKLSVDFDLTNNPVTGVTVTEGSIAIVSSVGSNQNCPVPDKVTPAPALRAWATHIQATFYPNYAITEASSQDATLSPFELNRLDIECYAINLVGPAGRCTCGTGD
jgi:hypothetical protein